MSESNEQSYQPYPWLNGRIPWIKPDFQICFYLFADILGFSKLLEDQAPAHVAQRLQAIQKSIEEVIAYSPAMLRRDENVIKGHFGSLIVMDTIVLYLADQTSEEIGFAFDQFLLKCSLLYLLLIARHDLLIRGVISSHEEYYIDKGVFLTKNLGKSHRVEKSTEWGAILVDLNEITLSAGPIGTSRVFPYYRVPYKGLPHPWAGHTLNPFHPSSMQDLDLFGISTTGILEKLEAAAKDHNDDRDITEKILNTHRHLKYCLTDPW